MITIDDYSDIGVFCFFWCTIFVMLSGRIRDAVIP